MILVEDKGSREYDSCSYVVEDPFRFDRRSPACVFPSIVESAFMVSINLNPIIPLFNLLHFILLD